MCIRDSLIRSGKVVLCNSTMKIKHNINWAKLTGIRNITYSWVYSNWEFIYLNGMDVSMSSFSTDVSDTFYSTQTIDLNRFNSYLFSAISSWWRFFLPRRTLKLEQVVNPRAAYWQNQPSTRHKWVIVLIRLHIPSKLILPQTKISKN